MNFFFPKKAHETKKAGKCRPKPSFSVALLHGGGEYQTVILYFFTPVSIDKSRCREVMKLNGKGKHLIRGKKEREK